MATDQHNLIFLGVALKYPIEIDAYGRPVLITGRSLIEQSLLDLLNTPVGTKVFHGEWGSRLGELVFEQNDDALQGTLAIFIKQAIGDWEKRITFQNVTFSIPSEEIVNCQISYIINATNQKDNFVYPFYRKIKY